MESVGLIAGMGQLPLRVAAEALERGHQVTAIAFTGFTDPQLEGVVSETHWLKLGQVEKAIAVLKSRGIQRVVMAGKIEKSNMMRLWNLRPDRRALRLIKSLEDWRDDTILAAIAEELLVEGIVVDDISVWASKLMAPIGVLTRKRPSDSQWKDIDFGRAMARGIGALDIGQTVVVKNAAVVAVEAIEGTDEAIRRAGELGIPDAVVVKMAKPQQDMRFDVPGIGPVTLESMMAARAGVLAIEAGKTMIADYERTISMADAQGIVIAGIPADGPVSRSGHAGPRTQ